MATGISMEKALEWEMQLGHDIKGRLEDGCDVILRREVVEYFARARTEDWRIRLREYWAWVKQRRSGKQLHDLEDEWNAQKHQHQHQPDDEHRGHAGPKPPSKMFCPDYPSTSEHDEPEARDLKTWSCRRTIAAVREKRIGLEFHGFMYLPAEIREIVYGHLLLKGTVRVPTKADEPRPSDLKHYHEMLKSITCSLPPAHQQYQAEGRCDNPDLRRMAVQPQPDGSFRLSFVSTEFGLILGVSRQVTDEALPVFFSRNKFILPTGNWDRPLGFNYNPGDPWMDLDTRNYAYLARDVSYSFDMRDVVISDHECRKRLIERLPSRDTGFSAFTPEQFMQCAHTYKKNRLEYCWARRIDAIKSMTLNRLSLNLEHCYCGVGCCRRVEWVCDQLISTGRRRQTPTPGESQADFEVRPPLVIEIYGWLHKAERDMIQEKLGRLATLYQSSAVDIRF